MLLSEKISDVLRTSNAGYFGGRISAPEFTMLICYSPDAEDLFQAVEPVLKSEPLCAGARILIRQGPINREAVIPTSSKSLN